MKIPYIYIVFHIFDNNSWSLYESYFSIVTFTNIEYSYM